MNQCQKSSHSKCKILFIDDSKTEIGYLELLFQIAELPATPLFINTAILALEELQEYSAADFPDIIIVDINMPLMDGFEFIKQYLELLAPKHPSTKLFLYSTSIHSKDTLRVQAIEEVEGFIPKPFDETAFNRYILPIIEDATKEKSILQKQNS